MMTWAEDRATVGTDPSADPGAKTEGRAEDRFACSARSSPPLRDWHQSDKSLAAQPRAVGDWSPAKVAKITGKKWPYIPERAYVKNGKPTSEQCCIRHASCPLQRLHGLTPAADVGPLAAKAVRQKMIAHGLCRNGVNRDRGRIERTFNWAVENELLPSSIHHGLAPVSGLRAGRSEARETSPVQAVCHNCANLPLPPES